MLKVTHLPIRIFVAGTSKLAPATLLWGTRLQICDIFKEVVGKFVTWGREEGNLA